MNDNNLNQGSGTYKATGNLNTAIDNPQINVNSATGVNVQDLGYNNYVEPTSQQTSQQVNNGFVNNNYSSDSNYSNVNSSSNVNLNPNSSVNTNVDSNPAINTNVVSNDSDDSSVTVEPNSNATYIPTLEGKKMEQDSIISILSHSKEFKALIVILFILCLFLLVMPYIYNFFRDFRIMHLN